MLSPTEEVIESKRLYLNLRRSPKSCTAALSRHLAPYVRCISLVPDSTCCGCLFGGADAAPSPVLATAGTDGSALSNSLTVHFLHLPGAWCFERDVQVKIVTKNPSKVHRVHKIDFSLVQTISVTKNGTPSKGGTTTCCQVLKKTHRPAAPANGTCQEEEEEEEAVVVFALREHHTKPSIKLLPSTTTVTTKDVHFSCTYSLRVKVCVSGFCFGGGSRKSRFEIPITFYAVN